MCNKQTIHCGAKTAWFLAAASLGFVWLGVALAWGGAWMRVAKTVSAWTAWEWGGFGIALAWGGICVAGLDWVARHWGDWTFALAAVGVSLATGLGWAWATRGMERWPMDSGLFRWFVERLTEGGFAMENLRTLAGKTDYVLWIERALPLYPLRVWTGSVRFGLAVQVAQAVAGALGALAAWRATHVLVGARVARWTLTAMVSMPATALQVVGLNHQVWGSFYFVTGIWLLAEWMFGGGGRKVRFVLVLLSLVIVPALCLEGYAGKMFLIVATILLGGESLREAARRKKAGEAFVFLVLLPGMLTWGGMHVWHNQLDVLDGDSSHGGQLAFCARGLDTAVWGEYAEDLDWLDILTPPEEKNSFFKRFIASQCAWNGKVLVTRLFPAKLAKFMLAGYASLAEEVLWANGAVETAQVARGMRVGWFLLLYGPLMLWGLRRLAKRLDNGRLAWCLLPVAGFAAAVMFAGETSPRYVMPIQPLLLAAGVAGLAGQHKASESPSPPRRPFATSLALATGAYLVFAMVLLGLRGVFAKTAFADMRTATLVGGHADGNPLQAPFEAFCPNGSGVVKWPGHGGNAVVYLHGNSWKDHGRVQVEWSPGNTRELTLPARLEIKWPDNAPRNLSFQQFDGKSPVRFGYASLE